MKYPTDSHGAENMGLDYLDKKTMPDSDKNTSTLTKAELTELAKEMVETFFEEICGALERGEAVKLSGFGNFQLRDKPQRPGRNPRTGEEIPITARRVVTFHASQKLKSMVESAEKFDK